MTESHHDPDLCRRLGLNAMGWEIVTFDHFSDPEDRDWFMVDNRVSFGLGEMRVKTWDPCCKPDHAWALEQQMVINLGYNLIVDLDPHNHPWVEFVTDEEGFGFHHGSTRLHATALAADSAVSDHE